MSIKSLYHQWRFRRTRRDLYAELHAEMTAAASDRQQDLLYAKMRKWGDRALERGDGFADIYYTIADSMEEGHGFGRSLAGAGVVPQQESALITLSESLGDLRNGLDCVVRMVDAETEIKSKLGSAASYPLFLFAAMIVVCILIGAYFPTTILTLVPLKLWPESAQNIVNNCILLAKYWPLTLGLIVTAIYLYFWSKDNWSGPLRVKVDRWPLTPYRLHADKTALGIVSQLGSSVAVGMQVKQALLAMQSLARPWQSYHLELMLDGMETHPTKPSMALDTGLLPQSILDSIEDSSGRDGLGVALRSLSERGLKTIVTKISARAKTLNMVLLVLVGLFMGIVIVQLFLGNYEALRNMSRDQF